ncbi:hypothetical protein F4813DRAFT_82346 [Daldinia decipiens]|uniref:uncharacterized protein n=1 Tax=Daldinia decipiens TaxID=326647 RepID=UPI0020C3BA46|nr:uncharacterized protein F4813DRAFT_82346 [Daldinia decipiens]KAI1657193.1 hypothetical protein F4813DRAFT_82346 [Daldinia decipiens]
MELDSHFTGVRSDSLINDDNRAPLIQILSWLFLSFCILSVAAQFGTKLAMSKRLGAPDLTLAAGLVLGIGQISMVLSPTGQVIGNSASHIIPDMELQQALMALYGSEILAIFTLMAVKGSLLIALLSITPVYMHRISIYGTGIITMAWGITAVFSMSFQCPSPRWWDVINETCTNISMKTYNAMMNILTDAALLIIPSIIILRVQTPSEVRMKILVGFLFRVLYVLHNTTRYLANCNRLQGQARSVRERPTCISSLFQL